MQNLGKNFEQKVRVDMQKIDGVSLLRLPDQWNGWKNSSNISDFIVYKYPVLVYLEAKSRYGNTFYLQDLTQYSKLIQHMGIKGVYPTVLIWFIDHDQVIAFPISSIKKMKEDGLKSINIKDYGKYPHINIPSVKKKLFMDSDYKILFEEYKQEVIDG